MDGGQIRRRASLSTLASTVAKQHNRLKATCVATTETGLRPSRARWWNSGRAIEKWVSLTIDSQTVKGRWGEIPSLFFPSRSWVTESPACPLFSAAAGPAPNKIIEIRPPRASGCGESGVGQSETRMWRNGPAASALPLTRGNVSGRLLAAGRGQARRSIPGRAT